MTAREFRMWVAYIQKQDGVQTDTDIAEQLLGRFGGKNDSIR